LAVNHSGDSDSTGSITGNILGAVHGEAALPVTWLQHLELSGRSDLADGGRPFYRFSRYATLAEAVSTKTNISWQACNNS
jgi:hypothetical protein